MLPLVADEEQIFAFKFWFNGVIQTGMYYRNELFCRLSTYDITARARVYHLGCRLAKQQVVVVLSSSTNTCSLWASLRDPAVKAMLVNPETLNLSD